MITRHFSGSKNVTNDLVDLGLSVKWAMMNIGASSPEEYGDYFSWGETEPKYTYNWGKYKYGYSNNLYKYNTLDKLSVLQPEDDAATVNWGDKWRIPTLEEWMELREKCNWTSSTLNGVYGYKVVAPNGNNIFLPDAGYYFYQGHNGGNGYYWSSLCNTENPSRAIACCMESDGIFILQNDRYLGLTLRPVHP